VEIVQIHFLIAPITPDSFSCKNNFTEPQGVRSVLVNAKQFYSTKEEFIILKGLTLPDGNNVFGFKKQLNTVAV